jgi:2-polyprenyl-3-methyl-5-hydroxy-6-metoxy-1,4-benzoquinol methylase
VGHARRRVIRIVALEHARNSVADEQNKVEHRRGDPHGGLDPPPQDGIWRHALHDADRTLSAVRRGACPACGGPLVPWREVPSAEPALQGQEFELLRCQCCGSAVTAGDVSSEIHDTGAYGASEPRLHPLALPLLRAFDAHRLAMLGQATKPPARLLDVGAGRGRFLASARAAGYDVTGIEPSNRGVSAAQQLDVPVQHATIEDAELEPASIDAAVIWHVLEHVDDPRAALVRVSDWLRPGGSLLVGVPNLASAQAMLAGPRWYHLDVPRHRTHFTPAGLDYLLRATGWHAIKTHHVLVEHNPFGMWQSLVNRFTSTPSYLYNLLKRNAPLRSRDLAITAAALPLVPLAALGELAAGLLGRGGTIAVVARRAG